MRNLPLVLICIIVYAVFVSLFVACGKEDSANINCVNKGDQCHVQVEIDQKSCSVAQKEDGTQISCPDGTQAFIKNGRNGAQGSTGSQGEEGLPGYAGPQGYPGFPGRDGINGQDGKDGLDGSVITAVVPCPANNQQYAERLLCIDDVLYAVFNASANETRLTVVGPGNYVTTDGRACHFTVVNACTIQ